MTPHHITWKSEPEVGTGVCEFEHLFGFDIVFTVAHDHRRYPVHIITRSEAMTKHERIKAVKSCAARDADNWPLWTAFTCELAEEQRR